MLIENGSHRRNVLVGEAKIGTGKSRVSGLYGRDTDLAVCVQQWRAKIFLGDIHRARTVVHWRNGNRLLPLHASDVERKQTAVLDDLPSYLVLTLRESSRGIVRPGANFVDERKIRRCKHAEVLAVLLVDTLDILGDDDLDSGAAFGIGRLFATATLSPSLAAYGADEASALYVAALNGKLIAALEADVGKLAQAFRRRRSRRVRA